MAITSSNVNPGDTVLASQQNSIVTDLTSLDTDRGLNNTHRGLTNNPHTVTTTQLSLNNVANYGIASEAEAQAGTSNIKYMTPLRTENYLSCNRPYVILSKTTNQTISTSTLTDITWNNEISDSWGFHIGSNDYITIPTGLGGLYLIAFYGRINSPNDVSSVLYYKNEAGTSTYEYINAASATGNIDRPYSSIISLSASDTLKLQIFNSDASGISVGGHSTPIPGSSRLSIIKIA